MKTPVNAQAEWETARDAARSNPTDENKARAQAAWNAYDASTSPMKRAKFASRAGKRQAAERGR